MGWKMSWDRLSGARRARLRAEGSSMFTDSRSASRPSWAVRRIGPGDGLGVDVPGKAVVRPEEGEVRISSSVV